MDSEKIDDKIFFENIIQIELLKVVPNYLKTLDLCKRLTVINLENINYVPKEFLTLDFYKSIAFSNPYFTNKSS